MLATAIAAGLLALQAAPATGQTAPPDLVVDDDGAQCPGATFTSIQAAVDVAPPGTRIIVCEGVYQEQVSIEGPTKSGITLEGAGRDSTTIKAPDSSSFQQPGDLVAVDGATGVEIRGFLISGPLPFVDCNSQGTGVRVFGGGSAALTNNRISEIRSVDEGLRGCQNGLGVVYGDFDPDTQTFTSGSGTVFGNVIDRYQKNGITVSEQGSNVSVRQNSIAGDAELPEIAQNGIQVSYGGKAEIRNNNIRDNTYTGAQDDLFDSGGIILFRPDGDTLIRRNTIIKNDYNIGLFNADNVEITANTVKFSTDLGGIFANVKSTGNLLKNNQVLKNQAIDCRDKSTGNRTAGTANTWTNNTGNTANPRGICRAP